MLTTRSVSQIDGTSADPEGIGDLIREEFYIGPVVCLGGSVC